jgi:hypothetical protein
MNLLSFFVECGIDELTEADSAPLEVVHVSPLIDGEHYIGDHLRYPFEPLEVIALGARPGSIWPFNCICGFRECADFIDPVKVEIDGGSVVWHLPDTPFESIARCANGTPKSRQLRFSGLQYRSTLAALLETLLAEEKRLGYFLTGADVRAPIGLERQLQSRVDRIRNRESRPNAVD